MRAPRKPRLAAVNEPAKKTPPAAVIITRAQATKLQELMEAAIRANFRLSAEIFGLKLRDLFPEDDAS
jgi:hypothetical protein